MVHDALHHPLAQPASAMRRPHEHIAEIRDRGEVADHPREAYLRTTPIINAEAQGMLNGSGHHFPRNALGPIAIRQESVDHVEIQPRGVSADKELPAALLENLTGTGF